MTLKTLTRYLLPVLLLLVTLLSLLPIGHPSVAPNDKLNHLLAWGALGVCAGLGWPRRPWVYLALLFYSLLIEVVQGWTGYRLFSLADVAANAMGIGLAMTALWLWYKLRFPGSL